MPMTPPTACAPRLELAPLLDFFPGGGGGGISVVLSVMLVVDIVVVGQCWVSQVCSSSRTSWHGLPPFCAGFMGLVRSWNPPPQEAEQRPQSSQGPMAQSTGQSSRLQACFSPLCPLQGLPPYLEGLMVLKRTLKPPPQDLVHFPQPLQWLNVQSMGQGCVLQLWLSVLRPSQSLPLCLETLATRLVRSCRPPPHVAEQSP